MGGAAGPLRARIAAFLRDWAEPVAYGAAALTILLLLNALGWMRGPAGWILLGVFALVLWRLFRSAYADGLLRRRVADGPGLVEIDERRIAYFGPETGGAISIDAIARVEIHSTADGPFAEDLFWIIETEGAPAARLTIPNSALGADRLLGALSALPGFDHEAVIRAMGSTQDARFVLFERRPRRSLGADAADPPPHVAH